MKRLILGVGAVWWVASIAGGISMLATYTNTPGQVLHAAPLEWPSSTSLALPQHRPAARQVTSVFGCSLIEPSMSTGAVAQ